MCDLCIKTFSLISYFDLRKFGCWNGGGAPFLEGLRAAAVDDQVAVSISGGRFLFFCGY